MNKFYYKYIEVKENEEQYYRIGDKNDPFFIPSENEVIVVVENGKLTSQIAIGDGRRSMKNLSLINGFIKDDLFVIKPDICSKCFCLRMFLRKVREFVTDTEGADNFWDFMDWMKYYTDLPVNDRDKKIYEIDSMIRTILHCGEQVDKERKSGHFVTSLAEEDIISEDPVIVKWSKNTQQYLPRYQEVLTCEKLGIMYLYVGDGEHVISELDMYALDTFDTSSETLQFCMNPKYIFDEEFRSIFGNINMGRKNRFDDEEAEYLDKLKKYVYVDLDDLARAEQDQLLIQIASIVNFADNIIKENKKVIEKGGYEI